METLPGKLCYLEKRDMLEIAGGQVAKILSNGDTEIVPLEMHMISGFNNQRVGLCKVIPESVKLKRKPFPISSFLCS